MITRRRDACPQLGQPAGLALSCSHAGDRASAMAQRTASRFMSALRWAAQAFLLGLAVAIAGCGGGGGGGGGGSATTSTSGSPAIAAILLSFPSGHVPAGATTATHNGYIAVYVANPTTGAPINNATVTFNGANVPYYVADQGYSLDVSVNSGDSVALSVIVDGKTYSVSTTQIPSYPTISSPAANANWLSTVDNIATWSGVVPNAQSIYMIGVTDTSGQLVWPANNSFQAVAAGTTSYTINAYSVTPGDRLLMVGIASGAAIANAASGSALIVAGFDYAPITVTNTPPPALMSIAVTPAHSSVRLGQTQQFIATGTYADSSTRDLTTQVTWQSSDNSRATIGTTGLATGVAYGSATMTASQTGVFNSAPLVIFQPNPSPAPPLSQAVAYQIDYAHSGHASFGTTPSFPANPTWSVTLNGLASYPLIADGRVFVITDTSAQNATWLYALDEADGHIVWGPVSLTGGIGYLTANHAYDHGSVFVVNRDGVLKSFNGATGQTNWTTQLETFRSYTTPPVAANGIVYVANDSQQLFAIDESTGSMLWMSIQSASPPSVSGDGVFFGGSCEAFKFDSVTGAQLWHYSAVCLGATQMVSVFANGRLYGRDDPFGLAPMPIFDGGTGAKVGTFVSATAPALSTQAGYFVAGGSLQAVDLTTRNVLWTFAGGGTLVTAPIVIDDRVVVGSSSGVVYALDVSNGSQIWSGSAGGPISSPDEGRGVPIKGLGAGEGYLVVPAGNVVSAWRISGP